MNFWRRRPRPDDDLPESVNETPPQPAPQMPQRTPSATTPRAQRLPLQACPAEAGAYAKFHLPQRVIIVGIGPSGYKFLEMLTERLDDTNLLDTSALVLAHVSVQDSDDTLWHYKAFDPINLIGLLGSRKPPSQDRVTAQWDWLRYGNLYVRAVNRGRYSARIMLFNHFASAGLGSRFIQFLEKQFREPFEHVFLVGSALEFDGANLIGDLAALVRANVPTAGWITSLKIHAFVLTEDRQPGAASVAIGHEADCVAATVYELGRLNAQGHVKFSHLPHEPRLNYVKNDTNLLSSVTLMHGGDGGGVQQAVILLWGMLTSETFFQKAMNRLMSPDARHAYLATANIVAARALIWPLRLLRDFEFSRLKLRLLNGDPEMIRRSQFGNRPPRYEKNQVNQLLLDMHGRGLYIPIQHLLNFNRQHKISDIACQELRTWLQDQIENTQSILEQKRTDIDTYASQLRKLGEDTHIDLSFSPKQWTAELPGSTGQALIQCMGWWKHGTACVQLVLGGSTGDGSEPLIVVDNAPDFDRYRSLIDEMVLRTVHNQVLSTRDFKRSCLKHERLLLDNWDKMPRKWEMEMPRLVEATVPRALFMVGIQMATKNADNIDVIPENDDKTFAMLALVTDSFPISTLNALRSRSTVQIKPHLIYPEGHVVLDVLYDDQKAFQAPVTLQNILSNRAMFWEFFWCWHTNTLRRVIAADPGASMETQIAAFQQTFMSDDQYFKDCIDEATYAAEVTSGAGTVDVDGLLDSNADIEFDFEFEQELELEQQQGRFFERHLLRVLKRLSEAVTLKPTSDTPEWLRILLPQTRAVFTFYQCWHADILDTVQLRGETWQQRIETFARMIGENERYRTFVKHHLKTKLQAGPTTVAYLSGDADADRLQRLMMQLNDQMSEFQYFPPT